MVIKESWQLHFVSAGLLMSLIMIVWQVGSLSSRPHTDDPAVTAQIKEKLQNNPALGSQAISVGTERGIVHLSGLARSVTEAKEAEKLASETQGVIAVRNSIHPKTSPTDRGCRLWKAVCQEEPAAQIETPKGINLLIHPVLWTEQANLDTKRNWPVTLAIH